MAKKLVLPVRYIRVDNIAGTRATRDKSTGLFTGREVIRGQGDKTHARRVTRNIDVNKDKKIDFYGGTIIGRTTKVRASSRAKAYQRSLR